MLKRIYSKDFVLKTTRETIKGKKSVPIDECGDWKMRVRER